MKKFTWKSAVILSALLGIFGCDQADQLSVRQENTELKAVLKYGVERLPIWDKLHPQSSSDSRLLRDILEGLFIYDIDGNIRTGVVESWQSADFKRWIFTLRQDARWSNGEPVTAYEFVRSWQELALSDSKQKYYLELLGLQNAKAVIEKSLAVEQLGISAINDRTLQIQLSSSTPHLPSMLTHIALLPHYSLSDQAWIGNGAYQLQQADAAEIRLQKNPYYWDRENVKFEHVSYRLHSDKSRFSQFDMVENVSANSAHVHLLPTLCSYFYEFNFDDPILQKSAVRSALISLISQGDLVRSSAQTMLPLTFFMPRHFQQELESDWQAIPAEHLLQQSGISVQKPLHLNLLVDGDAHREIAQRLAAMWSQSDLIRVQIENVDWQTLQQKREQGDFQIIRSGWCADYNDPSAFLSLFYSRHPDNKSRFKHKQYDEWWQSLLKPDLSASQRQALQLKMMTLLKQERVNLPLFQYQTPVYMAPTLKGYSLNNPTNIRYSKDLYRAE